MQYNYTFQYSNTDYIIIIFLMSSAVDPVTC